MRAEARSERPARPRRILLVEDDDDIRVDLAALLQDEGYEVICAAHGAQALELLHRGERPDLILLDLMMPTMDGWAFRAEQVTDAELAKIPVLLLTAAGASDGHAMGVEGCIHKPIKLERLFSEIRKLSASR